MQQARNYRCYDTSMKGKTQADEKHSIECER